MLMHLVKKDFYIIRIYFIVSLAIAAAIQVSIQIALPDLPGTIILLYTVIMVYLLLCQNLSIKESKFEKAESLLCSAPYLRCDLVAARYIFLMLPLICCIILYQAISLVLGTAPVSLFHCFLVTAIALIPLSIYIPIQYKFGYAKTKFILTGMILLAALFPREITLLFQSFNPKELSAFPDLYKYLLVIVIITATVGISMFFSLRIYKSREMV